MSAFKVANLNTYNLVRPGLPFYDSPPYSETEFAEKIAWSAGVLRETGARLIGFQEVFHGEALQELVARMGGSAMSVHAPGANRTDNEANGRAQGPKVGLASAFPVEQVETITAFPRNAQITVPVVDPQTQKTATLGIPFNTFNRPVLKARVHLTASVPCTVFVCHLKSKRPLILPDEDPKDPMVKALGAARSLLMRAAEAAALRSLVLDVIRDPLPGQRGAPCIVLGDLNDDIGAVSTDVVSGEPPFHRLKIEQKQAIWDVLLYNVFDIQARASLENVAFSHIWNGRHEVLDHILVSQEFHRSFPGRVGEVLNARVYNDHLVDETMTRDRKSRIRGDHGLPVAEILLRDATA